jgi:hypothetical protein
MEKNIVRLAWGCALIVGIPVAFILANLILETFAY